MTGLCDIRVHRRLAEALYAEAMLLADEARSYFDEGGRRDRESLDPMRRVTFSCESLKVTTRLMHAIAWLLTQRAVAAGEIEARDALDPTRRLADAPDTADDVLADMPLGARALIRASIDLHRRVARLDYAQIDDAAVPSPARTMLRQLQRVF